MHAHVHTDTCIQAGRYASTHIRTYIHKQNTYQRPLIDGSVFVIFFVSTGVVFFSALFAAESDRKKKSGAPSNNDKENEEGEDSEEEEFEYLNITGASWFIVVASLGLLLLYYFINYLVYVVLFMFCISGAQGNDTTTTLIHYPSLYSLSSLSFVSL